MKPLLLAAAAGAAITSVAYGADAKPEPQIAAVETVIVTAKPNPEDPAIVAQVRTRLSRTPGAVAVVAAETYENRLAQGFSDLLRDVPGVLAQKRYGEESRLSIRGSGIAQSYHQRGVLFAQDGVPFADADGFSDFQQIDALGARYVEVYKGGNALRFGGAQLGGAINLVTPTGRTAASENLLRLEGGSFGTARGQMALARIAGPFDIYGSLNALTTDGYRDNSSQKQMRGSINAGMSFGQDREIRLVIAGADIKQEVPGAVTLSDALAKPRYAGAGVQANRWARDVTTFRTSLQTRWRFNDSLVFEGGVYGTTKSLWHPISIVIEQESHTQGAFGRFDWTGEIAGRKADLFAGVSYRQGVLKSLLYNNAGGNRGFEFGDGRQEASGLDLFAEARYFAFGPVAIVAGGSYGLATRDYTDNRNAVNNASKDFHWLAPRVGLLWDRADGIQVYANLTRSVEPPTYGALVQSPNPGFVDVKSQKAWTGEIGTRGRHGPLTWDLTIYRAQIENEILNFTVQPGIPAAFFNAGDTIHQGLEAALDWQLTEHAPGGGTLSLRQSYTYSDFKFEGDRIYGDNRLPVIPEHQYRAELKYRHPSGWFIAPSVEWRPKDVFVDYANSFKAPGFATLSVNAGVELMKGITLFLDARNLTDKRYVAEFGAITNARNFAVSQAVFYPGEGVSVSAGTSIRF